MRAAQSPLIWRRADWGVSLRACACSFCEAVGRRLELRVAGRYAPSEVMEIS